LGDLSKILEFVQKRESGENVLCVAVISLEMNVEEEKRSTLNTGSNSSSGEG
jgi:hypothetical protein